MASHVPNSAPISAHQPVLAATDIQHSATPSVPTEGRAQALLAAPTDELTHKRTASASPQDQEHKGSETKKRTVTINHVQPCHFMSLPPELRVSIYKLAFHDALELALCEGVHREIEWFVSFNATIKKAAAEGRRRHLHHLRIVLVMLHISSTLRAEGIDICCRIVCLVKQSTEASLDELWPGCKNKPLWNLPVILPKQEYPGQLELFQICSQLIRRYEKLVMMDRMLQKVKQSISEIHAKHEETCV